MFSLKLIDLANGTNTFDKYKFYCNTLKWNREDIIGYQSKKLKMIINHAYTNVSYYRNWMNYHKISPEYINGIDDLRKLPVIDREIIQVSGKDLVGNNFNLNNLIPGSSSGTTGIPINYFKDSNALSAGRAAYYALRFMSGWKPGQRNIHIWGNASSIRRWNSISSRLKMCMMNQLNIPSTILDEKEIAKVADTIIRFRPVSIDGYPSAIFSLAQYFKEKGLTINELEQVITTAENIESYHREFIEEVFAPTGDLYGSGEIMSIAFRPVGDDRYYIFEPHVIVEAVDSGLEGMKDIIVTDLDNNAMPMIRYKIGDLVDDLYQPESNSRFPFSYFKKIIGRNADIINLPNGMRFHPINIFGGTLFRNYSEITKHRVIWNGEAIKLVFEIKEKFDDTLLKQQISELLVKYNISFSIEYTSKLQPTINGKYKYVEVLSK